MSTGYTLEQLSAMTAIQISALGLTSFQDLNTNVV